MRVTIKTVPHSEQRYDTAGDWQWADDRAEHDASHGTYYPGPCKECDSHALRITVSDTGDWRHAALLALHELVEAVLCRANGVSGETVDAWDMDYGEMWKCTHGHDLCYEGASAGPNCPYCELRSGDPGDDPGCPYKKEHAVASLLERDMAGALGVDWDAYEDAIDDLALERK